MRLVEFLYDLLNDAQLCQNEISQIITRPSSCRRKDLS